MTNTNALSKLSSATETFVVCRGQAKPLITKKKKTAITI